MKSDNFLKLGAIITAATVGDGVFALPFAFYEAGWLAALFYLVVLGGIVIVAHAVYLKTLEKESEKKRLLGLTEQYLGRAGFWVGFLAIVVGLLLALVALLVLGSRFVALGFPGLPMWLPLLLFWALVAITIIAADGRVVTLELFGIVFTSVIILLIFITAWPHLSLRGIPAFVPGGLFLPLGAILFSFAGWTGVEPAYELRKRTGGSGQRTIALASGTIFAAALYALFVLGILSSAPHLTPDTVSGLAGWPLWKEEALALLGIFSVWTVSLPVAREIKNSLEKDLRWNGTLVRCILLFVPLALVLLGFNDFLVIVGLVGGLFLSTQYLLIVLIGRRALALGRWQKFLLDIIAVVFIAAAVYSVYAFVVH